MVEVAVFHNWYTAVLLQIRIVVAFAPQDLVVSIAPLADDYLFALAVVVLP